MITINAATLTIMILVIIGSIILGFFIGQPVHISGNLCIDTFSSPHKDLYKFEITDPLDDLPKKKVIHLRIVTDKDLSQTIHSL